MSGSDAVFFGSISNLLGPSRQLRMWRQAEKWRPIPLLTPLIKDGWKRIYMTRCGTLLNFLES